MARHFWSVSKEAGHDITSIVTVGTSTPGAQIEVSTLDGQSLTKEEVVTALKRIVRYIEHEELIFNSSVLDL